jgi:hypothetical protein
MTDEQLQQILGKLIQTVELIADESAEIVDKFHCKELAKDFQQVAIDRANAVLAASKELRQVAELILDKKNLPTLVRR